LNSRRAEGDGPIGKVECERMKEKGGRMEGEKGGRQLELRNDVGQTEHEAGKRRRGAKKWKDKTKKEM